mgnify:CR=1 FL=1|jgi:formamidopyrimidine-DNA glycosylase
MPELPSVERGRRLVADFLVGKSVETCSAREVGGGERTGKFDDVIFEKNETALTYSTIEKQLTGALVEGVSRKGKLVWLTFCGSGKGKKRKRGGASFDLLFHFGMSGNFKVKGVKQRGYAREAGSGDTEICEEKSWPPKYTKLLLICSDGVEFAFTCPRRIGRVMLRQCCLNEEPVSRLGFDPYLEMPAFDKFNCMLLGRKGVLKKLLLDQTFVAGIGNWIADDVCLYAKVHPNKQISLLKHSEVRAIFDGVKSIVGLACKANGDSALFPKMWLFHYRWSKNKSGVKYGPTEETLVFQNVAGRTTAIVPSIQGLRA